MKKVTNSERRLPRDNSIVGGSEKNVRTSLSSGMDSVVSGSANVRKSVTSGVVNGAKQHHR
jgi:hypothetical protein